MVTHILGCLWIFTGNISDFEEFTDNQGNQYNVSWITKNGFDEIRNFQLYTISYHTLFANIAEFRNHSLLIKTALCLIITF